jgi:hypothetical protein
MSLPASILKESEMQMNVPMRFIPANHIRPENAGTRSVEITKLFHAIDTCHQGQT